MRALLTTATVLCLALPAAAQPLPEPEKDPVQKTLKRVFPAVVKVYGAGGFTGVPGYGTGVIVHERGFVLTTWSIALKTDGLKFVTHDGKRYQAVLWRADPGLGIALLRAKKVINARFTALRLSEAKVTAGDTVLAVGNPFGIIFGDEKPGVLRLLLRTAPWGAFPWGVIFPLAGIRVRVDGHSESPMEVIGHRLLGLRHPGGEWVLRDLGHRSPQRLRDERGRRLDRVADREVDDGKAFGTTLRDPLEERRNRIGAELPEHRVEAHRGERSAPLR